MSIGPGPQPSRPRRGAGWMLAGGGVLGLVLTLLFWFLNNAQAPTQSDPVPAPPTATPRTPQPTPTRRTPTPSSSCPNATTQPVVAGWQAVGSAKDWAAYDVPAAWTPKPEVLAGVESKSETVVLHCPSLGRSLCSAQSSGMAGLATVGSRANPTSDPRALAEKWARIENTDYSSGRTTPVPPATMSDVPNVAGQPLRVATVRADYGQKSNGCPAKSFVVMVVELRVDGAPVNLVVASRHGDVPDELTDDQEQQLVRSLRAL